VLLLSAQIDKDILDRYRANKWVVLRGTTEGRPTTSTYEFLRSVLGYDLALFFQTYGGRFRAELESIVRSLLSP